MVAKNSRKSALYKIYNLKWVACYSMCYTQMCIDICRNDFWESRKSARYYRVPSVRKIDKIGGQLVGSLKIEVSSAEGPYKRDYILQKRRIILRSLLIIATPYDPESISMCIMDCYVSSAKEPYKRDDILQKRRIILRSLLIVATPYDPESIPMCIMDW